MTVLKRGRMV
jgi:DNA-binding IscR family transcriptional regulator